MLLHEMTRVQEACMNRVEPLVLTIAEAAEALRISRAKAYRLAAAGTLPTVRVGATLRVPVAGLQAYVQRLATERER
jgi:excisionase family DNA binding protein